MNDVIKFRQQKVAKDDASAAMERIIALLHQVNETMSDQTSNTKKEMTHGKILRVC